MKSFRNSIKRFFDNVFNRPTLDLVEATNDCISVTRSTKSVYDVAVASTSQEEVQRLEGLKDSIHNLEMALYNKYRHVCVTKRDFDDFHLIWITSLICLMDQCDDMEILQEYGPMTLRIISVEDDSEKLTSEEPADE